MGQGIKAASSLVVALSPSLMMFLYVDFVKCKHHGYFPGLADQSWFELLLFAVAAIWQLLGVYALVSQKTTG